MMRKTETSGDDAAEEWLTPVNWEKDFAIKAERRRRRMQIKHYHVSFECFDFIHQLDLFHQASCSSQWHEIFLDPLTFSLTPPISFEPLYATGNRNFLSLLKNFTKIDGNCS